MPYNCLTNFEFGKAFAITRSYQFWQNVILTLDDLDEWKLIQLGEVTRINLALRNQSWKSRLSAISFLRSETLQSTLMKSFWVFFFREKLVTWVNLTRKKLIIQPVLVWQIISFPVFRSRLPKLKLPFIDIVSSIV